MSIVISLYHNELNIFFHSQDGVRVNTGAALGALCQVMSKEEVETVIHSLIGKPILFNYYFSSW